LSQAFQFSGMERYLSFTVADQRLTTNGTGPSDAFEVALLNANTGAALIGSNGIANSDALLNLQRGADGALTERAGSAVHKRLNPDGTTTDWVFTTGSATTLADRGISKVGPNALKAGEPVTAKFIPARNGNPLGFLKSITRADGTVLNISTGNAAD